MTNVQFVDMLKRIEEQIKNKSMFFVVDEDYKKEDLPNEIKSYTDTTKCINNITLYSYKEKDKGLSIIGVRYFESKIIDVHFCMADNYNFYVDSISLYQNWEQEVFEKFEQFVKDLNPLHVFETIFKK